VDKFNYCITIEYDEFADQLVGRLPKLNVVVRGKSKEEIFKQLNTAFEKMSGDYYGSKGSGSSYQFNHRKDGAGSKPPAQSKPPIPVLASSSVGVPRNSIWTRALAIVSSKVSR
jgi:hypothetical protein